MTNPIILPKLGNTVESSIILKWYKSVGDYITEGDILCEVETDKTTMEVESPVSGTLLALFYEEGADVPVLSTIAVVGNAGESFDSLQPEIGDDNSQPMQDQESGHLSSSPAIPMTARHTTRNDTQDNILRISPRAKNLAKKKHLDITLITGTGPSGRIIERDIEAALQNKIVISPVAKAILETGDYIAPERGSGSRGRISKADLIPAIQENTAPVFDNDNQVEVIPLKGVRKIIARRMLESMQTTAQLTLSRSVPVPALLDMRNWLKNSPATLGLRSITINDLLVYAVVKTLLDFPDLNMTFENDTLYRYSHVHIGFAVDTSRGLIVPVIRNADLLTLPQLADEAHRLADAALNQRITPDEMNGATFTVSNLGNLGVEVFTPVLNLPQVAILGVGSVVPRAVPVENGYDFIPHMTLSLTINHQVVDGAPGAHFLQALSQKIAHINEI